MAYTAVTYTFSNSTTADATQVNQNFTDITNGLSDGTKDISVNAITGAGTATFNGAVNLGNASSDDLTIAAALASTLSVKTNASYNVGSSTLGLLSVYLGATGSYTARITPSASQSATYTLTLPTTVGTKGHVPYNSDGSGALTWVPGQYDTNAVTADYQVLDGDGYKTIRVDCNGAAKTVTLPTAADNKGRVLTVEKTDSGAYAVTVDGEGAELVNGAATYLLIGQYNSITLTCNGTSWVSGTFNRIQIKEYSSIAGTGTPSSTTYTISNLVSGKVYRLSFGDENSSRASSTHYAHLRLYKNGVTSVARSGFVDSGSLTEGVDNGACGNSYVFTYNGTDTWELRALVVGTGSVLGAHWLIVEELNTYQSTTAFLA